MEFPFSTHYFLVFVILTAGILFSMLGECGGVACLVIEGSFNVKKGTKIGINRKMRAFQSAR
jgi:hypothetical protein